MKQLASLLALPVLATAGFAAEPPFTLALQAYTFKDRTMVETIETAKRLGFKAIELTPVQRLGGTFKGSLTHAGMPPETVAAVRAYLDACGIKAVSYGVVNAKDEAGWRKQFEFVRALGIGMLLTEPPPEQLPLIDRLAREYAIRVHLHNHAKSNPWWDPAFMAEKVASCSEWIGAGADIGHWVPAGVKPAEGIRRLAASRVFALHFVDVGKDGKPVPYGTGVGELEQVVAVLKAKGEPVVLTCEYEQWDDSTERNVRACMEWFEKIINTKETP
jgi:sugar phosphate isomerase/epimerase